MVGCRWPPHASGRHFVRKHLQQQNLLAEKQIQYLSMVMDYVPTSFHIDKDDFYLGLFNAEKGVGKM